MDPLEEKRHREFHNLGRMCSGEYGKPCIFGTADVLDSLLHGPMGQALADAAYAFETGEDIDFDTECLIRYAIQARFDLNNILDQIEEGGYSAASLRPMLAEVDHIHKIHTSATLMVDKEWYYDQFHAYEAHINDGWWTYPAYLDEHCPNWVLDRLLGI